MKILVLSNLYPPDFIGGYELACGQAVDGLIAAGHEVRVLTATPRRPVPPQRHVRRLLKLADIYDDYTMQRSFPVSREMRQAEARLVNAHNVHVLAELVEDFQPDAAYVCNVMGLGGLGLMGCLDFMRVPWVWQLGDCVPLMLCTVGDRPRPGLADALRRLGGQYIVVSTRLLREIESGGVSLGGRVDVLPNWIIGDRPPLRETFWHGERPLRIVSAAGRVCREKGFPIAIEAAGLLKEWGYENFELDLYGETTDPYFQGLVHRHGLEGQVFLKGLCTQEELYRRYEGYDVFVFPTWEREPFGLVPLEAVAHGCVPIMTRSCGVGEWLVHGVHCLKATRSAESFAGTLRQILEGEVPLEPIARRGYATAWRDFHRDVYITKLEAILARVARTSRSRAGGAEAAYRLALMAEKLAHVLVFERHYA